MFVKNMCFILSRPTSHNATWTRSSVGVPPKVHLAQVLVRGRLGDEARDLRRRGVSSGVGGATRLVA